MWKYVKYKAVLLFERKLALIDMYYNVSIARAHVQATLLFNSYFLYTGWPQKTEQLIQSIFRTLLLSTVICFHLAG